MWVPKYKNVKIFSAIMVEEGLFSAKSSTQYPLSTESLNLIAYFYVNSTIV